jgi:hypothetical protein
VARGGQDRPRPGVGLVDVLAGTALLHRSGPREVASIPHPLLTGVGRTSQPIRAWCGRGRCERHGRLSIARLLAEYGPQTPVGDHGGADQRVPEARAVRRLLPGLDSAVLPAGSRLAQGRAVWQLGLLV